MIPGSINTGMDRLLMAMEKLRHFQGPEDRFWPALLEVFGKMSGAERGILLIQSSPKQWLKSHQWASAPETQDLNEVFFQQLADAAVEHYGFAAEEVLDPHESKSLGSLIAVQLETEPIEPVHIAVFFIEQRTKEQAIHSARYLRLFAHTPRAYQMERAVGPAKPSNPSPLADILDILHLLNSQEKFLVVAMTLCNEVASRYKANRVSLGWLEKEYVRLQAVSHMEKFEKKMDVVRALEATMEEALDQDEEIIWPALPGNTSITRDHEAFAQKEKVAHLLSLPIRVNGEVKGVLTLERDEHVFEAQELVSLRILGDQVGRRVDELKRHDRSVVSKWKLQADEYLKNWLGAEHTTAKAAIIGTTLLLAILFILPWPYRVEATFTIRTEALAHLPAPFDGFIKEVPSRIGDQTKAGDVLLHMDTRELRIQEAEAQADQHRFQNEANLAQAKSQYIDMRIALAQAEQAQAKLNLTRHHLEQATIQAPFEGVIVEGDHQERIGSPVKKGEVLFKVAHIQNMYPEIVVHERDIHEIREGARGEIAFTSRPSLEFPFRVERVEPSAEVHEQGNVFIVRCKFEKPPEDWWRPGMSGVAKVNSGYRCLFWIFTHQAFDFLRMKLWL
jgi:RND family efflux transporter MFP subunit